VTDCKSYIILLHAIGGCDTTSGFYEKEKLDAVKLLIAMNTCMMPLKYLINPFLRMIT